MPQLLRGKTFGPNDSVTNVDLHNLVDLTTVGPEAVTAQSSLVGALEAADSLLIYDASAAAIRKVPLSTIYGSPLGIGGTTPSTGAFTNLTASGTVTNKQTAKAWVNFKGDTNSLASVSFTFSGALITATKVSHGLVTGDSITIGGGAGNNSVLNGAWTVTVTGTSTFTFTVGSTPAGALSAATVYPIPIRAAFNVSSVRYVGTGSYTVNFTTAMADSSYCAVATGSQIASGVYNFAVGFGPSYSASGFDLLVQRSGDGGNTALPIVNATVFAN